MTTAAPLDHPKKTPITVLYHPYMFNVYRKCSTLTKAFERKKLILRFTKTSLLIPQSVRSLECLYNLTLNQ